MKMTQGVVALMALAAGAVSANAQTTIYSTGFEAAEGYTNGATLPAGLGWQQSPASSFTTTNQTIGGSGAAGGSQWVLASAPSASTTGRWGWSDHPVTDFSVNSTIIGSSDVKFVQPASGTTNRTMIGGIQMYNAAGDLFAAVSLIWDVQNAVGAGANHLLIEMDFDDDFNTYDLGTPTVLNTYFNLGLSVNFQTGVVSASLNGTALPDTGLTTATDFHDLDMYVGTTTTAAGTRSRVGFDNFSIVAVPAPASVALLGLAGGVSLRRRRR